MQLEWPPSYSSPFLPKHVVYLMFRSNGGYVVIAARTKTTGNADRAGESGEGEERT